MPPIRRIPSPAVLILGFNRPDLLQRTIQSLRAVSPPVVFVSIDGPRPWSSDDSVKCDACRDLVDRFIDWPCELHRMYRDSNMGCRKAVHTAISEAFETVDELVVVEDDCLIEPVFYDFAAAMLERYRDDSRFFNVTASNFQGGETRGDGDYYASKYFHCWGWATWKRAWQHYEDDIAVLESYLQTKAFKQLCYNEQERNYWQRVCKWCSTGIVDTWDYRWLFSTWKHGGLTLTPNANLVTNIGFGQDATHTNSEDSTPPVGDLKGFSAPTHLESCDEADRHVFETVYCKPGSDADLGVLYGRIAALKEELFEEKAQLRQKRQEIRELRWRIKYPWKARWKRLFSSHSSAD